MRFQCLIPIPNYCCKHNLIVHFKSRLVPIDLHAIYLSFIVCRHYNQKCFVRVQTWHLTPEQLLFLRLAPASLTSMSSISRLSTTVGSEAALTVVRVVELLTRELLSWTTLGLINNNQGAINFDILNYIGLNLRVWTSAFSSTFSSKMEISHLLYWSFFSLCECFVLGSMTLAVVRAAVVM